MNKPPESVPLSAIRALVQQWRDCEGEIRDVVKETQDLSTATRLEEGANVYSMCADQLAALCPAPPEDQS